MAQPILHEDITDRTLKAFFDVHWELGPGFVESVYANAMAMALMDAGLKIEREVRVTVYFRGRKVGSFRADTVVESVVLLEYKAGSALDSSWETLLIHYLRSTRLEVGLLLYFGQKPVFKRRILTNDRKFLP